MLIHEQTARLEAFSNWVADHIKGDEKGVAQVFLDRFFRAFGHDGLKEAGATHFSDPLAAPGSPAV